jgi:hypothetical protein
MFLDDVSIYFKLAVPNARKVSIKTTSPNINKASLTFTEEKRHGNFDLYFNKRGILMLSFHFEKNGSYKIIYGYNNSNQLLTLTKLHSESNIIQSNTSIKYNSNGKIISEKSKEYYIDGSYHINKNKYSYSENYTEIKHTYDLEKLNATTCLTYNNNGNLIEDKRCREVDDVYWWDKHIYENGLLVKTYHLDGEPGFMIEHYPQIKNLPIKEKMISPKGETIHDYNYEFDNKDNWILRTHFRNDIPITFCSREIEFYPKNYC